MNFKTPNSGEADCKEKWKPTTVTFNYEGFLQKIWLSAQRQSLYYVCKISTEFINLQNKNKLHIIFQIFNIIVTYTYSFRNQHGSGGYRLLREFLPEAL